MQLMLTHVEIECLINSGVQNCRMKAMVSNISQSPKRKSQQADESEREPIDRLKDFFSGVKDSIVSINHIILLLLQVRNTNCYMCLLPP